MAFKITTDPYFCSVALDNVSSSAGLYATSKPPSSEGKLHYKCCRYHYRVWNKVLARTQVVVICLSNTFLIFIFIFSIWVHFPSLVSTHSVNQCTNHFQWYVVTLKYLFVSKSFYNHLPPTASHLPHIPEYISISSGIAEDVTLCKFHLSIVFFYSFYTCTCIHTYLTLYTINQKLIFHKNSHPHWLPWPNNVFVYLAASTPSVRPPAESTSTAVRSTSSQSTPHHSRELDYYE